MRPAPPFTPHAGAPAPPTPAMCTVCSLGVNPVGAARVRSSQGWRLGAARRRCVSLEVLCERCAVHVAARSGWSSRGLHGCTSPHVCARSAYRRMCARAIAGLEGERRRALEMVQSATWREARRLHIMRCSLQRKQREGILQNERDLADVEERCGQSGVPYRAPLLGPQKSSAR